MNLSTEEWESFTDIFNSHSVIVELTGLKNMKYITTILMLIVGFQFSICAETLVFEKVFKENEIPITTNATDWKSLEDFQHNLEHKN